MRIPLVLSRRKRTRGQSIVEFAMILPVFALLFAATLDLGRLFYAQITLTNAAREGAFQAARTPELYQQNGACNPTTNLVICRVVLESNQSFIAIQPSDVRMTCSPSDCPKSIGSEATVRVSGRFTFLTPIVAPFFGGGQTITLRATATAQREFVPTPPPSNGFPTFPPTPTPSATPTSTATSTATSTRATECTITSGTFTGQRGVFPPNVINMSPSAATTAINAKGLRPVAEGDLTTGQKNKVREQSPDWTECVEFGHEVHFKYRP